MAKTWKDVLAEAPIAPVEQPAPRTKHPAISLLDEIDRIATGLPSTTTIAILQLTARIKTTL